MYFCNSQLIGTCFAKQILRPEFPLLTLPDFHERALIARGRAFFVFAALHGKSYRARISSGNRGKSSAPALKKLWTAAHKNWILPGSGKSSESLKTRWLFIKKLFHLKCIFKILNLTTLGKWIYMQRGVNVRIFETWKRFFFFLTFFFETAFLMLITISVRSWSAHFLTRVLTLLPTVVNYGYLHRSGCFFFCRRPSGFPHDSNINSARFYGTEFSNFE